jgi:tetratricopeptide (TPR) repeat protein
MLYEIDPARSRLVLEDALKMNEQISGPESEETATTLNNLALTNFSLGDYTAAKPLYERAFELQMKLNGPDHPALVSLSMNFASTVRALGDYEKARQLLENAIKIATETLPPDHFSFAHLKNGLGIVLFRQGEYTAALEQLEIAGSLARTAFGPSHGLVHANLQHQARVFHKIGDLETARRLYEKLGENGGYGPGTASELALVLAEMGEMKTALEMHELGMKLIRDLFGADHAAVSKYQKRWDTLLEEHKDLQN